MRKNSIIIAIVSWIIVLVLLIGIALGIANSDISNYFGNFNIRLDSVVVKEVSYILEEDIKEIVIDTVIETVDISLISGNEITLVQYGEENIKDKHLVKVTKNNGKMIIDIDRGAEVSLNLFNAKLIVGIPETWIGDLEVEIVSGNIIIRDDLIVNDLDFSTTSGSITTKNVVARKFTANTVSGNITVEDLDISSCSFEVTSGNINAGLLSGECRIETISGNIGVNLANNMLKLDAYSLSGNVKIGVSNGLEFEFRAKWLSGKLRTGFSQYQESKEKSTRFTEGDNPTCIIEAETLSGNIYLD